MFGLVGDLITDLYDPGSGNCAVAKGMNATTP
jgi:hypothetical protein